MKKLRIVLPLFLLAVLLFGLAACTGDVFAIYEQAEEKTSSIKTGKQKVCLTFSNEADMVELGSILKNGKNRSPEAAILYETLNKFKDFRIEFTKQYDVTQDKYISDGYIRFNIYNLEGKLYKDKDSYIIEKLQIPKYVRFTSHEFVKEFFKQYGFEGQNLSFNCRRAYHERQHDEQRKKNPQHTGRRYQGQRVKDHPGGREIKNLEK